MNSCLFQPQAYMQKIYLILYQIYIDKKTGKININLEDEIIEKTLLLNSMEIDPFIFRLSIFILSIFMGYYVVWSVTPSLHTPLMFTKIKRYFFSDNCRGYK